MSTNRLGLAFIPRPPGEAGGPIIRVVVKNPLGGGEMYPEPFRDGVFLTLQEYHPRQLELQVKVLKGELDEIVKTAKGKYARRQGRLRQTD